MYIFVLIIFVVIILILIFTYFNKYHIVEISDQNKKEYHNKIKLFEKHMTQWYPLGNDSFMIDHGKNYYSFFEMLGKVHMNICLYKGQVVATACAVLRNIKNHTVWYICDLKVHPKHRGNHIPFRLLLHSIDKITISNKGYGICMNDDKKDNKIYKLIKKNPSFKCKKAKTLMIYSVDYNTIKKTLPIIKKYKGSINFLSLKGKKDLILKSTNIPINLLHLQYGNGNQEPIPDYTYMFCCVKKSHLYHELKLNNIKTDITADIIHYNMNNYNWDFILTSDI